MLELIDSDILNKIEKDLERAETIWTDMLVNLFGNSLQCLYRKGSSQKQIIHKIDYVPELSDLDLHFTLKEDVNLMDIFLDPARNSLALAKEYHDRFVKEEYFHIPRMQVMDVTQLKKAVDFVPNSDANVKTLYGKYTANLEAFTNEKVRELDAKRLIEMKAEIDKLPWSLLDRSGHDYWSILRRLSWKVSPTPVRLLSQVYPKSKTCWSWSRSETYEKLLEFKFKGIADWWEKYYMTGWKLFEDGFHDVELYTEILIAAYKVLELSYNEFKRIK